jgi:hypothetical protein
MTTVAVTTNSVTVDVTGGTQTVIVQTPAPLGLPVGGTTSQVLTKTSSADFATTWTTVPTAAEFAALEARVAALEDLDILLLEG